MEYSLKDLIIFATLAALLQFLTTGVAAEEYGSSHNSHPPFQFIRSRFTCISQNKEVLWDAIVVEVHPGATEGCGTTVERYQDPDLWSAIDRCINEGVSEIDEECTLDEEYGIVFKVNQTKLISNKNITLPCVAETDIPEIVAIHLIYTCRNDETSSVHPDDDIMTLAPMLPPIPPNSGSGSTTMPPPPQPDPTMVIDHTDLNTPGNGHVVVSEVTTASTKSIPSTTTSKPVNQPTSVLTEDKPVEDETAEESSSHPITYNELAVIVGPSVAAIAVLILILILVIVLVKRRTLKLPTDLQGESLFYSRRFSTASQLSDISVTGQQMRTVP